MNRSFLEQKDQSYREEQVANFYNVSHYGGFVYVVVLFLFVCMAIFLSNREGSNGQNDFFIRVVEADGYSVLIRRDSIYKVSEELNFHIQGEQLESLGFSMIKKNYLVEVNGVKQSVKYTDIITMKPDDQITSLVFYQIKSFGIFTINIKKQEFRFE
jgi:hypothetical protein